MEAMALSQKSSPDDSGQATKQKARWAERKCQGSRNTREDDSSPFLTKASAVTGPSGLGPERPHLYLRSC